MNLTPTLLAVADFGSRWRNRSAPRPFAARAREISLRHQARRLRRREPPAGGRERPSSVAPKVLADE
jgi:hypothetical protein